MPLLLLTVPLLGPLRVLIGGEPLPRRRTRSVGWRLALGEAAEVLVAV